MLTGWLVSISWRMNILRALPRKDSGRLKDAVKTCESGNDTRQSPPSIGFGRAQTRSFLRHSLKCFECSILPSKTIPYGKTTLLYEKIFGLKVAFSRLISSIDASEISSETSFLKEYGNIVYFISSLEFLTSPDQTWKHFL